MRSTGKVYLIGAGPGDPELMTLRAVRMLAEADAVVYDRLVSPEIMATVPRTARLVPVGKTPGAHTVPQDRINEILAELAGAGLTVARLKGGDPMIFGRGSEEAAYLALRGIAVEYAPGITSAQGAAASTGVPLTHRGLAGAVQYVTGHRQADRTLDLDWKRLADPDTTLVVYMGVANIGQIALRLIAEGMPAGLPVMADRQCHDPARGAADLAAGPDRAGPARLADGRAGAVLHRACGVALCRTARRTAAGRAAPERGGPCVAF